MNLSSVNKKKKKNQCHISNKIYIITTVVAVTFAITFFVVCKLLFERLPFS